MELLWNYHGPVFANIFMDHLEYKVIPTFIIISHIQYMDYCLVVSKTGDDSKILFDKLNSLHRVVLFTREMEVNIELSFLSLLITRRNGKLKTFIDEKNIIYLSIFNCQSFCIKRRKIRFTTILGHRFYKIFRWIILRFKLIKLI